MSTDNTAAPFQSQATRSATILIVDDEDGVRRLLTHWINSLGYTAKAVGDAESALEVLRATPIDVVVCDIRMPGHDGVWLIDQVRKDFPSTAIVIATGLPDVTPSVTMQSGVAGYLIKPFERQDLATVLGHALMPDSPWLRHLGHPDGGLNDLPEI
jgi:YesN/AraC family two-component response regulator